jgi:hypothetical protein
MSAPAIPVRCAHRPQVAGMVVPWTTLQHPHTGHLLGRAVHELMVACVRSRICQICGEPLEDRAVLLCRQRDLAAGYAPEPAMHPECAAYAAKACPMLNGRMTHHRAHPRDLAAMTCQDPGCPCHALGSGPDEHARAGHPAEEFVAVWLEPHHIRPRVDEDGHVLGTALRDVPFLRLRPVPAPHRSGPRGDLTQMLQMADSLRHLLDLPWTEDEATP